MKRSGSFLLLALSFLTACSGGGGADNATPSPVSPLPPPSTAPYLLDATTRSLAAPAVPGAIADTAIACTVTLHQDQACTLGQLPLLGMQTLSPDIDAVMARTIVTHSWMATRFRELLALMPPEILLLMRGLTAVVISSEIRPSFYTTRTGAIYLDPAGMWLTEAERAVISTREDPRAEDIRAFQFLINWRYVDNESNINTAPRSLESLRLRLAALLYHELAHANDYFPPDRLGQLDTTVPIYGNVSSLALPSTALSNALPLQSSQMKALAAAAFLGVTPTAALLQTTPAEVATEFPLDVANDYYNYATPREDLAMAFEEAMMLHSFGVQRDVAVTSYPPDVAFCDDLVVHWGQRNRIAELAIGARSLLVVERILPESAAAIELMLANLVAPVQMRPGQGWCENIVLDESTRSLSIVPELPIEGQVEFLPLAH
ncbi:MAG: hypothetical protein ACFHX7_01865 [Pseudomonadota bacterium]